MGEKVDFVIEEGLISTAFFGGVWTALEFNPETALLHRIGEIGVILGQADLASDMVAAGRAALVMWFILVVLVTFTLSGWLGLLGFVTMWFAGYLFIQGYRLGIALLFVGWGLGVAGIAIHTDEQVRTPSRTPPPRF